MSRSTLSLLTLAPLMALITTAVAQPVAPPAPLVDNPEFLSRPPLSANPDEPTTHPIERGRACRGDLFTIGVPVGRALDDPAFDDIDMPGVVVAVRDGLMTLTDGDGGMTPRRVASVATARVIRGNDRHWLIALLDDQGRRMRVKPDRVCEIVFEMRRIATAQVGDILSIGRECDATPQADWHEVAMTPEPGQSEPPVWHMWDAPRFPNRVQVAVIDGPMTTSALAWSGARSTEAWGQVKHPHADAMARLIREVAPEADIVGYTALDDSETGTPVSAVAQAIRRALDDRDDSGRGPQIINLSLGWPPEMGRPATLTGRRRPRPGERPDNPDADNPDADNPDADNPLVACTVIEDPTGESVRELLAEATDAGVVVVAAAGNRVGPQPLAPELLGSYRDFPRLFPCLAPTQVEREIDAAYSALFFPAAWSQVPTCAEGPAGAVRPPVRPPLPIIAVGAYGRHGEPPIGDASLFAPGIGVPLSPVPSTLSQRLPGQLTGTSVAAALTSGYIAELLSHGYLMDAASAVQGAAVECPAIGPGKFLRRCMAEPLPDRAPRVVSTKIAYVAVAASPPSSMHDKAGAGSLGPQPPVDPCGDDCRFLAPRGASTGRAEVRMLFDAKLRPKSFENVEIEVRIGTEAKRYAMGAGVALEMTKQLQVGKIALDITGVPITVTASGGQQISSLQPEMSVDLVYVMLDEGKQPTRRRSRLIPGYVSSP